MDQSVPIGVAAFQCETELRNLRMRPLTEKEIAAANKRSPRKEKAAEQKESPKKNGNSGK